MHLYIFVQFSFNSCIKLFVHKLSAHFRQLLTFSVWNLEYIIRSVSIMLEILPIILLTKIFTYYSFLCLPYYSKIILRRYTCIRSTSFKIVGSNEVKSFVLAAICKQGAI